MISRAVKINALIYEIIVAEINAIKYFNAVNATLFTSGVRYPLTRNRRVPMSRPRFTDDTEVLLLSVTLLKSTQTCHTSCSSLGHSNKPANESLLSHTTPPHWSHVPPRPVH